MGTFFEAECMGDEDSMSYVGTSAEQHALNEADRRERILAILADVPTDALLCVEDAIDCHRDLDTLTRFSLPTGSEKADMDIVARAKERLARDGLSFVASEAIYDLRNAAASRIYERRVTINAQARVAVTRAAFDRVGADVVARLHAIAIDLSALVAREEHARRVG